MNVSLFTKSRRRFLSKSAALAGSMASYPLLTLMKNSPDQIQNDWVSKAKEIIGQTITVDLHSHLGLWESKGATDAGIFTYQGDENLKGNLMDMISGGCQSAYICITSDMPIIALGQPGNKKKDFVGNEGWEEYRRQMQMLDGFFKILPLKKVTRTTEIEATSKEGKVAVFLSTEGGHMIEGNLDRLSEMYEDGVRRFQPIHYAKTRLGDNQSDPAYFGGLTPEGKSSIKEANRLMMLIDMAHASFQATKQAADLIGNPIVLSHTMMKYESVQFGSYHYDYPRWISEDHAQLVAATGGVIGTWPLPKPLGAVNEDAFIEAVFRMVDRVGIDHVGWATDYIDAMMPTNPVFSNYKNFPKLCGRFLEKGFSASDLEKFIGGNAARVHRTVCGG